MFWKIVVTSFLFYHVVTCKLVFLKPIKAYGFYTNSFANYESYYLSREQLEIIEKDDSTVRLCDVLPLAFKKINNPDESFTSSLLFGFSSTSQICNRDKGLYDNLPYTWGQSGAKKQLFDFCNYESNRLNTNTYPTPSHKLCYILQQILQCNIHKIYVDIIDEYDENKLILGAAMELIQTDTNTNINESIDTSTTTTTILTTDNNDNNSDETNEGVNTENKCVINIHIDELICLAMDLNLPIYMEKSLYHKLCIDATLINTSAMSSSDTTTTTTSDDSDNDNGSESESESESELVSEKEIDVLVIQGRAPTITTKQSLKSSSNSNNNTPNNDNLDPNFLPIWYRYDATEFISMTSIEKRDLLRKSGITNLPRPREGVAALDTVLMEYMDAAVRLEYQRLILLVALSNDKDNQNNSRNKVRHSNSFAITSKRQQLLQQISSSLSEDNMDSAVLYRDEFARLTQLRADPTQDEGSYDSFLDQDDWYMKERMKAMRSPSSSKSNDKK